MHVVIPGRPRLSVRSRDAEEKVGGVIAGLRLGSDRRAGGRIVERRGIAAEIQVGRIRRIWLRVELLLAVAPAELELVFAKDLGVVLFNTNSSSAGATAR